MMIDVYYLRWIPPHKRHVLLQFLFLLIYKFHLLQFQNLLSSNLAP